MHFIDLPTFILSDPTTTYFTHKINMKKWNNDTTAATMLFKTRAATATAQQLSE
jgi:hypothetical protein